MRILLVHQYFQEKDGAGGSRFNEMTRIWQESNHKITVIAGNLSQRSTERKKIYKGKFVLKNIQDNIEVYRCFVSKLYNKNFIGRFLGYLSFVLSGLYAGLFKIRGKFDIIIVSSPPLFVGIIAYIISIYKKTPFLFEVRDLWPESAIDTGVIKNRLLIKLSYLFERFIYRKAKLINVLTPAFYHALVEKKGIPENKLVIIPNAADFRLSDDLQRTFNAQKFRKETGIDDHFVIVYVGAHGRANGLDQILDTAERLKDTNVLFLLIGDGMNKKKLVNRAAEMKINNVRFINPIPKQEVIKYILASDMGTSVLINRETFKTIYSNKTFDYMSCKKPVLMAIDGLSRELIEIADAGVFIQPENPVDFEMKIRNYLADTLKLKQQGENGYQYAKMNFDREVLAKEFLIKIDNLLKTISVQ